LQTKKKKSKDDGNGNGKERRIEEQVDLPQFVADRSWITLSPCPVRSLSDVSANSIFGEDENPLKEPGAR
jgi:hypothetical protein